MKPKNWHKQDIIAAVRIRGSNLRRLGLERGFFKNTLYVACERPFPHAQQVIADYLGLRRQDIWPEFYDEAGQRRRIVKRGLPRKAA